MILKAARASAAFDGRTAINDRDIALAAELALPHRMKGGPFQREEIGMEELHERIEQLTNATASNTPRESSSELGDEGGSSSKKV